MKIISLSAENFKRLHAVYIKPDGSLVQITGKNAQGKSSVLDAIWAALGGKDASPARPIRKGAAKAEVVLDLGDMRVIRRWSGENTSLIVESADGARYPSPQAVLDKLVGRLGFDAIAFSRMDGKKQAATLRELVGVDTSAQEGKRTQLYELRTGVNRELKAMEAQLKALPEIEAPDEEISVADLARAHAAAAAEREANDEQRRALTAVTHSEEHARRQMEEAERALERAQLDLADAQGKLQDFAVRKEKHEQFVAALVDPDLSAITAQMQTAEQTNAAVRTKKARAVKAAEVEQKHKASARLSLQIDGIDAEISKALGAAKFPIPNLSFDADGVTFNGLPLEQASSAEQLRVGLAIGAALNPKLRVILVRDGSLLDADALRLVAEWAEQNGMQVIMERVADNAGPCGVVIEDGRVRGAAIEEEAAAGEQLGLDAQ